MPALWIARVDVTDPDTYAKYIDVASVVIPAHGGTFIARGGAVACLEGEMRSRNVVARFPSMEAGQAAYNDPRYQAALEHAHAASTRDIILVETSE